MNIDYIRSLLKMYNNRNIYNIEASILIYEYFNKPEKRISDEEIEKVYEFIKSQDYIYEEYVRKNIIKLELKEEEQKQEEKQQTDEEIERDDYETK